MSRIRHLLDNGNVFVYGLDKPTGGFFWQELDAREEDELAANDGLTLSQLQNVLDRKFIVSYNLAVLVQDFYRAEKPSHLQVNVGKMFGKDIHGMLQEAERDIIRNFKFYIPQ
jgi:hypothetical protein